MQPFGSVKKNLCTSHWGKFYQTLPHCYQLQRIVFQACTRAFLRSNSMSFSWFFLKPSPKSGHLPRFSRCFPKVSKNKGITVHQNKFHRRHCPIIIPLGVWITFHILFTKLFKKTDQKLAVTPLGLNYNLRDTPTSQPRLGLRPRSTPPPPPINPHHSPNNTTTTSKSPRELHQYLE